MADFFTVIVGGDKFKPNFSMVFFRCAGFLYTCLMQRTG